MKTNTVKRWLEYETGEVDSDNSPQDVQDLWEAEGEKQALRDYRVELGEYSDHLDFYRIALPFSFGEVWEYPLQKARTLAEFYPKFNHFGKTPFINSDGELSKNVLSNRNPECYIGVVFDNIFKAVENGLNE